MQTWDSVSTARRSQSPAHLSSAPQRCDAARWWTRIGL